jgi:hypothetical protein
MVEEAVAGRAVINTWTTNSHTLTTADGTTSESRCAMLEFTDTGAALTGAATVVCPSASKLYVCKNDSGQQVTIQTAAGTGVAIPDGQTMFVFCDGTNVEQCTTNFNSLSFNDFTLNFGGAVTTAGAFTTSGAYALTLTTTGATNVTLPTTGTLATLDGTETLTNKTLTAPTISSPSLTGSISATDLTISGNTTIGDASADTLTVNSTITSNLIFTDDTYDIGAVGATRPRNLYLSGDATIGGTVTLSGGIDVTGALGVDGNFDVNTDKFTVASATGNTAVAGTLGVTGVTTATGGLNVDTISEITAAGGVTVDGVLLKDGGATLTSDLTVDTDTLYVDSTNDRVGINEATPLEALHVTTSDSGTTISKTVGSTSGPVFVLDNTDDTTNNLAAIQFASSGSSSTDVVATTGIYSINTGRGGTYSYGDLAFYTTNSGGTHTEAMRIDSSQRVLIGTTSDGAIGNKSANLQVRGTSGQDAAMSVVRNDSGVVGGSFFTFGKSRGNSDGDVTSVNDDDTIGTIRWAGADGTDFSSIAASIAGEVDGTPGTGDMPGRIIFQTTASGAASGTERMRIQSNGFVGIGNGSTAYYPLHVFTSSDGVISRWRREGGTNNPLFEIELTESDSKVNIRSSGSAIGPLVLGTGSGEALTIDSSQRVLIKHTTAQTFSLTPQLSVLGTDASSSAAQVGRFQNGAFASYYQFAKSRATSIGSHVIVQDDDTIGNLRALADDGVNYDAVAASIEFAVDGTPGTNDMPGRIVFSTSADGADSPTQRMTIKNDGKVGIGITNPTASFADGDGVQFNPIGEVIAQKSNGISVYLNRTNSSGSARHALAIYENTSAMGYLGMGSGSEFAIVTPSSYISQKLENETDGIQYSSSGTYHLGPWVSKNGDVDLGRSVSGWRDLYLTGGIQFDSRSNKLDDYEEGTWTPTYQTSGTGFSSITYDTPGGRYTKIGNVVHIQAFISTDGITKGSASGNIQIGGLPFTAIANIAIDGFAAITISTSQDFAGDQPDILQITAGNNYGELRYRATSNGPLLSLQVSDMGTGLNDNVCYISGTYLSA